MHDELVNRFDRKKWKKKTEGLSAKSGIFLKYSQQIYMYDTYQLTKSSKNKK